MMGLLFFADQCVPNTIVKTLRQAGHSVVLLREQLPVDAPDVIVIDKAQQLDAILLSLDGDFADITAYPPIKYQGIIALQIRNHPEISEELMVRFVDYLAIHTDRNHYRGKLLIVEIHRIRTRC